jgi:hypothetical protein
LLLHVVLGNHAVVFGAAGVIRGGVAEGLSFIE